MKQLPYALIILFLFTLVSCDDKTQNDAPIEINPAAPGFNLQESDQKAIALADEVMKAMGGRAAWDKTRYLKWTFFGRRTHIWDKLDQKVQIQVPGQKMHYTLNMKDMSGEVSKAGINYTQEDSIKHHLNQAHKMWINDSYWLVMPFKLKDSGVTLKYIGPDTTQVGADAEVLELTFNEVGVTPDNKYLVYVDEDSKLVTQWDYFASYTDSLPRFQSPWPNYEKYGNLLLSGGEIGGNKIENIQVSSDVELKF